LNKRSKAINTAEKLNEFHKKNNIKLISVESNPSTQVYRIVEEILKSTENKI
jgi:ABC-type Zn uptake system ZnuABC Zn-binding protein ZnuA